MRGTPWRRLILAAALPWAFLAAVLDAQPATAQDTLKVSAARRGTWDGAVIELIQRLGYGARHGIALDITYVWSSRDAVTATAAGTADIGVGADVVDVLDAFQHNDPVRIIANQSAGAHDLYWYVRASSPIRSWQDTDGRTIAYSTDCCTRSVVEAFIREKSLKVRPVATGWASPTLTQVLSGQIDIGWATPPSGLDHLANGQIRILAQGSDTTGLEQRTMRVVLSSLAAISNRTDVVRRFMRAWRQTVRAMYEDPQALKAYAEWRRYTVPEAEQLRDRFFPAPMLDPDRLSGITDTMAEAIAQGRLTRPIPEPRLATLIQRVTPP